MITPPTGTVTFLYTDIEGSTRLRQAEPAAFNRSLARHDDVLQQAIESHEGYVFKTIGDAFCAAFPIALEAVQAALEAQRQLHAADWGATPMRVRMALHTGDAQLLGGDYKGFTMARIARLLSAGHGGQTLLSASTEALVRDQLPAGTGLRDLGERRLKDLVRLERIFQLVAPDLPAEFPPLVTLDNFPHNLPVQLTSFVGRDKEIAEAKRLLAAARLLTLVGPGGAGKSRLSLQVATDLLDQYPQGAWLVELAPVSDPALVPQAVAAALDLQRDLGRADPLSVLADYLRDRRLLLILDNCEHLVDACAQLADHLLRAAPELRILASSREGLGIAGETTYRIPSLALPDPQHLPSLENLTQYEAVQLFIERASAAQPGFVVTNANAPAVAQICYRLDGIPLALELAAARVKVLRVEDMLRRLDDVFRLLTGGSRTSLPRHQTLRAAIDWSNDLLPEPERALLRRLSVFSGGWSLEAAEAVCAEPANEIAEQFHGRPVTDLQADPGLKAVAGRASSFVTVFDLLANLVNKSLINLDEAESSETRYRMLETIRQYAAEKLLDTGEAGAQRDRHLAYFLQLAETAAPELGHHNQLAWLERLDTDLGNLRAALQWSLEHQQVEVSLRLATALWEFWLMRGRMTEGRHWLQAVLSLRDQQAERQATRWDADALLGAGWLAGAQDDEAESQERLRASLDIFRTIGDAAGTALALFALGTATLYSGGPAQARPLLEESLALWRSQSDPRGLGNCLHVLGHVAYAQGRYSEAHAMFEQSIQHLRAAGDLFSLTHPQGDLAWDYWRAGETDRAVTLFEDNLGVFRRLGAKGGLAMTLQYLAEVAAFKGDFERGLVYSAEDLALEHELGGVVGSSMALHTRAIVEYRLGDLAAARASIESALRLEQEPKSQHRQASFLGLLGQVLFHAGEVEQASRALETSLRLMQGTAYKIDLSLTLLALGRVAYAQGEDRRAADCFRQALLIYQERNAVTYLPPPLEGLAGVLTQQAEPERAARLFGASAALRERFGTPIPPVEQSDYERDLAAARAALGDAFEAAWHVGQQLSAEEALAEALASHA